VWSIRAVFQEVNPSCTHWRSGSQRTANFCTCDMSMFL